MRLLFTSLLFAALALAAWPQGALQLSDEERAALPPEAAQAYGQALAAFEQRAYAAGFRNLNQAATLAPESAPLQQALVEVCMNLAEQSGGEMAPRFLGVAREALDRIVANPAVSDEVRRDAQERLSRLGSVAETIAQRASAEAQAEALRAEAAQRLEEGQAVMAARLRAEEAERQAEEAAQRQTSTAQQETPVNPRRYMQAIDDSRTLRDQSQQP